MRPCKNRTAYVRLQEKVEEAKCACVYVCVRVHGSEQK